MFFVKHLVLYSFLNGFFFFFLMLVGDVMNCNSYARPRGSEKSAGHWALPQGRQGHWAATFVWRSEGFVWNDLQWSHRPDVEIYINLYNLLYNYI